MLICTSNWMRDIIHWYSGTSRPDNTLRLCSCAKIASDQERSPENWWICSIWTIIEIWPSSLSSFATRWIKKWITTTCSSWIWWSSERRRKGASSLAQKIPWKEQHTEKLTLFLICHKAYSLTYLVSQLARVFQSFPRKDELIKNIKFFTKLTQLSSFSRNVKQLSRQPLPQKEDKLGWN